MNKETLWRLYVTKNPSFAGNGNITMSAAGLKKLFDQTYDKAHDQGVRNGRALEQMKQQYQPKTEPPMDMFNGMFGGRRN